MEEKIQKLSEGMDFIEEAVGNSTEPLSFSDAKDIVISEGKEHTSPYKILGKACGCFAPIGAFSRNNRLYSDDLWPKVLANEEFSSRLARREVFGCLGHADKLVDDRDIQEGKVSHIVTCLDVREDMNGKPYLYGELEILDTPAGRILEAMYKGGANLYVSSRAAGKLIPVPGQTYSMVRPEQYHVHCFDVVARPGFLQARPTFEAVSVEPTPQPTIQEKQIKESEEQVTPSVTAATSSSWEAVSVASNPEVIVASESEVEVLKEQIDKLAKVLERVVDDIYEANEEQIEEGRKPGESDEEMKDRLHKELVNKIEAGAEKKEKEGKFTEEERKKVHDKLGKLDDIKPVAFCGESSKAALIGALGLLSNSDVSEGLFEQIVDILKKSKEKETE